MIHPTRHRPRGAVRPIVTVALVGAVLLGVFVFRGFQAALDAYAAEQQTLETLTAAVEPYLDLELEQLEREIGETPYRRGKVVVVNADTGEAEPFWYQRFDETLRASTPGEIGTVVLFRKDRLEIGEYEEEGTGRVSGSAWQWYYEVTVIDAAGRRIIGETILEGGHPGRQTRSEGDQHGSEPFWDLVEYVQDLEPR